MTTPVFRPGAPPLKNEEHVSSSDSSPVAGAQHVQKTSVGASAAGGPVPAGARPSVPGAASADSLAGQRQAVSSKANAAPSFGTGARVSPSSPFATGPQAQPLWNKPPVSPFSRATLPPANPVRPASVSPGFPQRTPASTATTSATAWPATAPRPSAFLKRPPVPGAQPPPPLSTPRTLLQPPPAGAGAASPFRKDLRVSDEEFIQLRDFIYQQCGIFIAENRKYLIENRLSSRIKELNLKSYNEYYNFLRFDVSRKTELNKLFEVVTTNETSFYRNPPQLEVFQNIVLTDIVEKCRKAGRKRLRLWSAGCSTGEEPYTLAIILHEVLKGDMAAWDIKITANDLSDAVLNAARRGIYSEYALRTTPPEIVSAYFTKDGNTYRVNESLKRIVAFGQINLNDKEHLKRVERSQIVFCRNVIIYFDDDMKRRVINAYYDNLEPDGVLLIGHSESLHNITRAFQLEQYKGTIVYRKKV
jgi:chemotaxis protein methyltransferase CheR